MAKPFRKEELDVEFKPEGNITSIYDLMSCKHDRLKADEQGADAKPVQRVIVLFARKRALCLGEFAGERWVIG